MFHAEAPMAESKTRAPMRSAKAPVKTQGYTSSRMAAASSASVLPREPVTRSPAGLAGAGSRRSGAMCGRLAERSRHEADQQGTMGPCPAGFGHILGAAGERALAPVRPTPGAGAGPALAAAPALAPRFVG